jgi:hypothetical protein
MNAAVGTHAHAVLIKHAGLPFTGREGAH